MRIVRNYSRKKYLGLPAYEYERFFIPVPSKSRSLIRPWHGRDLEVFLEPVEGGLAVLLCLKDEETLKLLQRFRDALKRLEKGSEARYHPVDRASECRDIPVGKLLKMAEKCPFLTSICKDHSYVRELHGSKRGSRSPES